MCSFMFSGCFELIEEIKLNDDGSGHIEVTLNISKSKTKLQSIMLMDSINNYKVPSKEEISKNIKTITAEIGKIDGVTGVKQRIDFDEFIFAISCDFTNIEVLNEVISHFNSQSDAHININTDQFSYDKKKKIFKRKYEYNLASEIKKVRSADRKVLQDATITTIYRFDSTIANATNQSAKISGSKNAIMLKVGVQDMIADKKSIKNSITLN